MSWFRCVAESMVKYGSKALAGAVPFGDVLLDVAKDVWEKYRKQPAQGSPANLAADLQAVAAAPAADVQKSIAQAVQDVAADQPPEVKKALTEYLDLIPYTIRRSLRRPSDPSGTTVSATLAPQQARDLVPFLPPALPRFKAGDRPLPGVPLVLKELLGKGGFGEVWLAHHPRDNSLQTALKFCLDERAAQSLRHEAKALGRVRREGKHAAIVELRHVWDENEPLCLEYEYIEGGDLRGLIREMHAAGPPSPDAVAREMLTLLEPIRFVHSLNPPIVHRDLKPANILVERQEDESIRLRIADFGISDVAAREALRDTASQSHMTVGVGGFTALYASPQQIKNDPADPRDDVHALGVIWLQMLTGDLNQGRPSGPGWKAPLRGRGMTDPMLELIEQCMDDDPGVRPTGAGDLADRITNVFQVETNGKERLPRVIVNSIGMKFMLIPAGTFLMGSPEGEGAIDKHPQKEEEITQPFYLSAFQVTQEQYQSVMGENPSSFCSSGRRRDEVKGIDTKRFPVESVSWDEAVTFCARLSNVPEEKKSGRAYRLPTEAQWEYACRGGATSHACYHFGNSLSPTQANFADTGLKRPCPVGSYPANAFGLFDMHGNVWDWCDTNVDQTSPKRNSQSREKGESRVQRGGSWFNPAWDCRSANRFRNLPSARIHTSGFRVCFLLGL